MVSKNLYGFCLGFDAFFSSVGEDFLLIVLKDLLPRRLDLRFILMSAILNAELSSSFVNKTSSVQISCFTHPVALLHCFLDSLFACEKDPGQVATFENQLFLVFQG